MCLRLLESATCWASAICSLSLVCGIASDASAQDSLEITIRAHMGNATQVVMPQTRSFVVASDSHLLPARIAQPAAQIESVAANIRIIEQTAATTLDIHLRNPSPQQMEAVLLLPVPEGAVVSQFAFEGAASEPTAQVLTREEARRLYDAIVAKVRDPALLEFAGYNLIRSSVFPIAAGGTQRIRLTYENLLSADNHRVDFVLPRSESLERRVPWNITVDLRSASPISTVYSPSHEIESTRRSANHFSVKATAAAAMQPGPFLLSYLLETNGVSASLFAYPDPKIGGGYFLLMAGLPASSDDQLKNVKREITLVIDRSGSMAGDKMDQARAAAMQIIEGLSTGEAFNIIDYATNVSMYAGAPVIKTDANRLDARRYIESIKAGGGTNIHDALLEALRPQPMPGMLPIVLFLTDGLATVGRTSEIAIRELAEKGNTHRRRVFTFGVGHDVNVPLLDRLADITRASATYVLPKEDIEVKVAKVFQRLYGPAFSDIQLTTAGAQASTRLVRELIPSSIPDLFEGDQLILLGQYQTSDPITFRVAGKFRDVDRSFEFKFDVEQSATTKNAFVPRLWASRRIAYLVDQIRQAGAELAAQPTPAGSTVFVDPKYRELADEILRLSTEFGILTEYTSFLATEGTNLGAWDTLRDACASNLDARAVKTRSGMAAVNQGLNFNWQKGQTSANPASNSYFDEHLNRVEVSAVQQVCDRTFYKRGAQWIDARLITKESDHQVETLQPDQVIEFGTADHLALLHTLVEQHRQAVLSLQGDIIIQVDGRSILVRQPSPSQN